MTQTDSMKERFEKSPVGNCFRALYSQVPADIADDVKKYVFNFFTQDLARRKEGME